jgi:NAD(P)-dependent dehydrogenase (short-subunit alcohol dehydrogenase family)
VVGGFRGLGLELARELGRRGARVAICARERETLERARQDLDGRGVETLALPCDVTDQAGTAATVQAVHAHWGRLDVLVNNAGVIQVGPITTMTLDDFRHALAVNFWGALHGTWAALPLMRAQGGGRIVNIVSIGGKISAPHLAPYTTSKFALAGWSEALHVELAAEGIRVTTVYPGRDKPRYGGLTVCWGKDEKSARRTAHRVWPNAAMESSLSWELPLPKHFEDVAKLLTEDAVAEEIVCGPDPERHVAAIMKYVEAGFDHVGIHQVGPDQAGFFQFYATEVLPRLKPIGKAA